MVSRRKIAIAGILVAVLIIALILFIYIYYAELISNIKPTYLENGPISTNISVFSSGLASYNQSQSAVIYAYINYNIKNATDSRISLSLLNKNPIQRIYLLNDQNACYDCFNTASLELNLTNDLSNYGLLLNSSSFQTISVLNTSIIQKDSIVIIPTGIFPATLLPYTSFTQSSTIIDLLNENDTIFYIGRNFSRIDEDGQILVTNNQTESALFGEGISSYSNYTTTSKNPFNFKSPTFRLFNGTILGDISYLNLKDKGTLAVFSNYPKVGWSNATSMSQDISSAIASRFWMQSIAHGSLNISKAPSNSSLSGKALLITLNQTINATGSYLDTVNSSYALITVNSTNGYRYQNYLIPFHLSYLNKAVVSLPSVIGYDQLVPLRVSISNYSTNKAFSLVAYNYTKNYIYSIPLDFFNTSYSIYKYSTFDLPTGQYYVASLVDINNNSYGNAVFYVPYLHINTTSVNFVNGTFTISVLSGGIGLSNMPYTISIDGQYTQHGTIENGVINYTLPKGTTLNYGLHDIELNMINVNYILYRYYQSPPAIPPIYLEFLVAAILIFLLNIILKPPVSEDYFIDIPQIPPIKKQEVVVSSEKIISLFDNINNKYSWKYMPLTPEEIKVGISSNIRNNNMPISITLENTRKVLYSLSAKGKVDSVENYYMPSDWIKKSGHDAEYLVIFRRLRDFLVAHALPFTDLDQAQDADMIITIRDKVNKIFIFSKTSGVRNIKLDNQSKYIILFLNSEERYEFKERLESTFDAEMSILRFAIFNNQIILGDLGNLKSIFL
ncbi:MAG: hypothetical protein ACP5M9_01130 [Candidatus Micrarchaeia archaeon]